MSSILHQLADDCLIGNLVYELCSANIWIIPFSSIYKWSDKNNLNIAVSNIQYFADSCNFKIIVVDNEYAIDIPKGAGDFDTLEYLRRKYRIGLPKDIVEQLRQSISEQISKEQPSICVKPSSPCTNDRSSSTAPTNLFTEPQIELYSVLYKLDTGVDYIYKEYLVNATSQERALSLAKEYFKNTAQYNESIVEEPTIHVLRKEGVISSSQVGCY